MNRRSRSKKIVLGVTGSYGSGKSTVAGMLRNLGAAVIDADAIARECLVSGHPVAGKILRRFGPSIMTPRGTIDRGRLAARVFGAAASVRAVNALVHPWVLRRIRDAVRTGRARVTVIDAPLLIESGLFRDVDAMIVVRVQAGTRLARLKRLGISRAQVRARLAAQMPQNKKEALADYIVDNDGTFGGTKQQVVKIWHGLEQKMQSKKTGQK